MDKFFCTRVPQTCGCDEPSYIKEYTTVAARDFGLRSGIYQKTAHSAEGKKKSKNFRTTIANVKLNVYLCIEQKR